MKISRTWLQKYFETPLPATIELVDALTFHAFEVENVEEHATDSIIEVKVLANRAADCFSHRGIAKELSAILNISLKYDPFRTAPVIDTEHRSHKLEVIVDNQELCDRYIGAVITGVRVESSPTWLKDALEAIGVRSINNVVDAANYVMFDIGQPLHVFDANLLNTKNGVWHVRVRNANAGEKITTLSNEEKILTPETLVIVDDGASVPIAIAGVKGGNRAEVTNATTDIIIESAHFQPASIRRAAQQLRLQTDASKRFENNISPETALYAMDAVVELILKIAGGNFEGISQIYSGAPVHHTVSVSGTKMNNTLGTTLSDEQIKDALRRLDLPFTHQDAQFVVSPPFERVDIVIPEDVVEEVGRIVGLSNITAMPMPPTDDPVVVNKRYFYAEKIRASLVALGFDEVMTYAMGEERENAVAIENPIASDKAFLRTSLSVGIVRALAFNIQNAPLLGKSNICIFEIGSIFRPEQESLSVGIGVFVPGSKSDQTARAMITDAKEAVRIACGAPPKYVRDTPILEFFLDDDFLCTLADPIAYEKHEIVSENRAYQPISPYPFALRDIALWAPQNSTLDTILSLIRQNAGPYLVRLDQFDTFTKEGRISYAFHLVFQSNKKTLTDAEVDVAMTAITKALNEHGCSVR